jgi:hypothetical protein
LCWQWKNTTATTLSNDFWTYMNIFRYSKKRDFVVLGFLLKTSSPTNPYTKNIGFLNLANVKVFKKCVLLYYSQCLCFVAGCLLLLAFKCKKTMKKNKREEQQERRRKNKKRTHIYEEQQQKQRQSMSQKQRERQENVKNNTQQE